jgi:uncharacterized protein (DUF4415 family)
VFLFDSPDSKKAEANRKNHDGVTFDEAKSVFDDARNITVSERNTTMKPEYDFSKGKRGVVVNREPPLEPGKVKISIRLDEDVLQRFSEMADNAGGKVGYQSLINSALREYLDGKAPRIEEALRRIVREELTRVKVA